MEIRRLEELEVEALLDLLDGWSVGDGWRGRDFFRRYIEDDSSFGCENVWVACDGGRLESCVQIFPRTLSVRGGRVSACGIGSVFTRAERRGEGLAPRVLTAALTAARERGFELGVLFAGLLDFYRAQGWVSRPRPFSRLEAGDALATSHGDRELERDRELPFLVALHARQIEDLDGPVLRDEAGWLDSLRLAGNPNESIRLARRGRRALAYLRYTVLDAFPTITEWAFEDASALADLVAGVFTRPAIPGSPGGGEEPRRTAPASTTLRAPHVFAPDLVRALEARHIRVHPDTDTSLMLLALDRQGLARRFALAPDDIEASLLRDEHLELWLSDRF
jgi:GNAT superfamily N-acetyltransferase